MKVSSRITRLLILVATAVLYSFCPFSFCYLSIIFYKFLKSSLNVCFKYSRGNNVIHRYTDSVHINIII